MWQPLVINNRNYLLKLKHDDTYTIFLTDLINIWVETLSNEKLVERFEEFNPLIRTVESTIVKYVVDIFESPENNTVGLELKDEEITLKINSEMSTVKFQIWFTLKNQPAKIMSQELVIPLMISLYQIKEKQDEIIEIIAKKDLELKEHKFHAHILENKNLCTEPCNVDELLKDQSELPLVNIFQKDQFKNTFFGIHGRLGNSSHTPRIDSNENVKNSSLKKARLKRLQLKGRSKNKKL